MEDLDKGKRSIVDNRFGKKAASNSTCATHSKPPTGVPAGSVKSQGAKNRKFCQRRKIWFVACKAWLPTALDIKAIRVFSLFLRHCQIKFGMRCPFGVWPYGAGSAQEQPDGRKITRNQAILERLAAPDSQLAQALAADRNAANQQLSISPTR
ncbi:hypothetical protein [Polaromonas sp. CG_9.11]|uniref:hypothetical protein n=1 Tax=Polaromonas sp. CG_9.11 TaxID=2787730 RepID=UPI0018C9F278|nr:hypothetical protein [Polaromonas sp. CG_9.11]MBG6075489.1 hypothetical protein [Polaromonas sp. CG_9.11]